MALDNPSSPHHLLHSPPPPTHHLLISLDNDVLGMIYSAIAKDDSGGTVTDEGQNWPQLISDELMRLQQSQSAFRSCCKALHT